MTARAAGRALEVGVRKAVGATRRQIIVQFLGECLCYTAFALLLAMVVVEQILPVLNEFLQRHIVFDYVRQPLMGGALLGVWLVTGLSAGAYAAVALLSRRVLRCSDAHYGDRAPSLQSCNSRANWFDCVD